MLLHCTWGVCMHTLHALMHAESAAKTLCSCLLFAPNAKFMLRQTRKQHLVSHRNHAGSVA